MKKFIPVFVWAVVIFFLSVSSRVKVPESLSGLTGTDKIGHMVIYSILSILMFYGFFKSRMEMPDNQNVILIVGLCSGYGLLMEILQFSFFTGRYFEVLDIIANIIGSFIGLFVFKFFFIKKS